MDLKAGVSGRSWMIVPIVGAALCGRPPLPSRARAATAGRLYS
jgi:hypothetical protein